MSDIELNKQTEQESQEPIKSKLGTDQKDERDMMDGGFAVVDRERLIEEETKEVTPWYKYFLMAFTAPGKMMEECYGQEPYKGASYGVVGCIVFTLIYVMLTFSNPVTKDTTMQALRNSGIAEDKLNQVYSVSKITGTIGGVIGVFFTVLLFAVLVQIIKAILKDKAKFANIYKMLLIVNMVPTAILVVDGIVANIIGIQGPVFQLATLFGGTTGMPPALQALCSIVSLSNIVMLIWLVIGYKSITHVSTKKAVIVAVIYEIIAYLVSVGSLSLAQSFTGMANTMGA